MSRHVGPILLAFVVALLLPGYAQAQVAPTPDQSFLTLMASGDGGTVTLAGRDLASFASAAIVPANPRVRPVGITARLGAVTRAGLPLTIGTEPGVAAGDYYVELVTTRGERVRISLAVTVEAADAPPVIDAVTAPRAVLAGEPLSVTVSASDDLGLAAIQVSWPGGSASTPLAGSLTAKESVAIAGLAAGRHSLDVVVTDRAGNQSPVQTIAIEAVALALTGFTLSSPTVDGGQEVTGTVTLGAVAPAAQTITLDAGVGPATVPASVTVPAGAQSATFAVTTEATAAEDTATLTASLGVVQLQAALTVLALAQPRVLAVSVDPPTLAPGQSATGTVQLDGSATVGGMVVALGSHDAAVSLPTSVTVLQGAISASFAISIDASAGTGPVDINAAAGMSSVTAAIEVVAPTVVPSSITVGVFTFAIEPLAPPPPFAPVTVAAGDFTFAIEPMAPADPFTPMVIQVGSFVFAIHPLQTGGN